MKKTVFLIAAAFAVSTAALAQESPNPADYATLENGFVRIGELRNNSRNNVGASSFLFPSGDKLVTGLHSSIGADAFLSGLKDVNSLYNQLNYNLVSYGWKGSSYGYHTIEVGARAEYGLSVPKEIFQILKTGTSHSPYNLASLRAFGNLYGEIAYSFALPLGDRFFLGTRIKLLAGLSSVDVMAWKFQLTTTAEKYMFDLDADMDLTNAIKKIGTDENGYLDYTSISGKGKLGAPSGFGMALDLGFRWEVFDGFTLDASVSDIGGILWSYGNGGRSSGTYTFEGLKSLSIEEMNQEKVLAKVKDLGDEVVKVVRPKAVEKSVKIKDLPFSAAANAAYAMPFWKNLSVKASGLYTGYSFCAPYWEARGGLALDFPEVASLYASAGSGAYGFVYNVSGSVNFLSFKLYASFGNGIGGYVPYEDIPLKANSLSLVAGLIYLIK